MREMETVYRKGMTARELYDRMYDILDKEPFAKEIGAIARGIAEYDEACRDDDADPWYYMYVGWAWFAQMIGYPEMPTEDWPDWATEPGHRDVDRREVAVAAFWCVDGCVAVEVLACREGEEPLADLRIYDLDGIEIPYEGE